MRSFHSFYNCILSFRTRINWRREQFIISPQTHAVVEYLLFVAADSEYAADEVLYHVQNKVYLSERLISTYFFS